MFIDTHNGLEEYARAVGNTTENSEMKITILEARITYLEGQMDNLDAGGNAQHSVATYPRNVYNDPRIAYNDRKEEVQTNAKGRATLFDSNWTDSNEQLDTTKAKANSVFPLMELVCSSPSSTSFICNNAANDICPVDLLCEADVSGRCLGGRGWAAS